MEDVQEYAGAAALSLRSPRARPDADEWPACCSGLKSPPRPGGHGQPFPASSEGVLFFSYPFVYLLNPIIIVIIVFVIIVIIISICFLHYLLRRIWKM